MKQRDYQHHSEHYFEEGDQVFLLLEPYKQTSFKEDHQKLAPKFYGPYDPQAYCAGGLQISTFNHSKIHLVFHVSYLNKVVRSNCRVKVNLLELDEKSSIWLQPNPILDKWEHHLRQCTIHKVLVQWKDTHPKDATWEPTTILQRFPHLKPWDKAVF